MDLIVAVLLGVVGLVALLGAYGAWLIGQGSAGEQQAREIADDNDVLASGVTVLDWLRVGDLPVVAAIEDYLDHLREVWSRWLGHGDETDE